MQISHHHRLVLSEYAPRRKSLQKRDVRGLIGAVQMDGITWGHTSLAACAKMFCGESQSWEGPESEPPK